MPQPKRYFPQFVAPLTPINHRVERCSAPSRAQASRRVLITRTGANGDILMGTPLLAALRAAWPDAHLTWMVDPRERQAIDAHPLVDELLLWDPLFWKRMTRRGLYPIWAVHALRLHRLLREKNFDTFISFQPEDWPTLARSIGAKERIGVFDTFREYHGQKRTSRRARLYTTAFTYHELPPHRVDQYLLPLRALQVPEPTSKRLSIGWTDDDERDVEDYLRKEVGDTPFVVIAPLTGWPSRIWPLERFATVADNIAAETGCKIILTSGGGAKDVEAVQTIAAKMRTTAHLALGRFGLRGLSVLIDRAALVLSGDTGPMHIASAVNTPYVALFGPSPIERFAPLVGRGLPMAHRVPCGPCHQLHCPNTGDNHQLCMKLLTTDEVTAAALSWLAPRVPGSGASHHADLPVLAETAAPVR